MVLLCTRAREKKTACKIQLPALGGFAKDARVKKHRKTGNSAGMEKKKRRKRGKGIDENRKIFYKEEILRTKIIQASRKK